MPGDSDITGHSTTDMTDYTDSPEAIAFTRVPNEWIDRAMPTMSAAEWMITTVILRQTIGWHKERDAISLSQFELKTGLARHTCIKALRSLISARWIKAYEHGIRVIYEPSFADGAETAPDVTGAETAPALVQKLHHTSAETAPKVVQKLHTQKKERKKKERKETMTRANAHVAPDQPMNESISDEPQTQTKPKRESTIYGDLFVRIAAVCHIDPKIGKHAKQISSTAKYLEARGVTPDRVDAFATWWSANDFRGKRGEYPYPSVIAESWLRFEEGQTTTSSTKPSPAASRYATTTTSKSGTFRRGQAMFTDEQRAAAQEKARRELEEEGDDLPISGKMRNTN